MTKDPSPPAFDPNSPEHASFVAAARAAGLDPRDPWVASYADYEWTHLRPLLGAYGLNPAGGDILEFGSNVGGSLVTLATLGGRVTGLDVNKSLVRVAKANAARYGVSDSVRLVHATSSRTLPFATSSFDLIIANSVLEYVDTQDLSAIISEFRRVLRPGGKLLICGTASRLAPRELHSRRWFANYVPRFIDRLTARRLQRGLSPLRLASSLRAHFKATRSHCWRRARIAVHGRLSPAARLVSAFARVAGISPGWLSPYIELLLERCDARDLQADPGSTDGRTAAASRSAAANPIRSRANGTGSTA